MDAEERRALEAELAEDLAGLGDDDDDYVDGHHAVDERDARSGPGSVEGESEYVRLDLDHLMWQFAAISDQKITKQQSSAASKEDKLAPAMSSWELLLASVQTSDAEFFQFIRQDLHDIQTTILTRSSPDTLLPLSRGPGFDPAPIDAADPLQHIGNALPLSPSLAASATISSETGAEAIENGSANEGKEQIPKARGDPEPETRERIPTREELSSIVAMPSSPAPNSDRAAAEDRREKQQKASDATQCEISSSSALPAQSPEPSVPDQESQLLDQARQRQLKLIQEQHLTRQRQLQRAQEAHQLEQKLIACQIQEMEKRFAEEEVAQKRRELAQQQARERLAMQKEEMLARIYLAEAQRAKETERMIMEEQRSRAYNHFLLNEQQNRERERLAMASEETLAWKRVRFEAEKQRRERLLEEKCILRRRFNNVMFQLVARHEAKVAEQKKQEDSAKRREAREMTLMRSEEFSQRRVFAQRRALEEEMNRNREREAMAKEDSYSHDWAAETLQQTNRERSEMEQEDRLAMELRIAAEKRKEDMNRLLMAREEERSRMAQVLEIQREHLCVKRQAICRRLLVHRKRGAYLGLAWSKWTRVVADQVDAVLRIQRCYRAHRRRQIRGSAEDFSGADEDECEATAEYAEEASAAAMVVQSMFRGFSIRRKFANALEMAQLVGDVDELEFGEVNLDELIQMPPELEDGWENPVLPGARHYQQRGASVVNHLDEEDGPESGDYDDPERNEDCDNRYPSGCGNAAAAVNSVLDRVGGGRGGSQYFNNVVAPQVQYSKGQLPPDDATPPVPAPLASLAANLWDKMRKMKQKQRHAAEERSREQDPTYRLQKLMSKGNKKTQQQQQLAKTTNNSNNGNQGHGAISTASNPPTISWGSSNGNGEKKKPKVKLPSLVERLRKKTEAAR